MNVDAMIEIGYLLLCILVVAIIPAIVFVCKFISNKSKPLVEIKAKIISKRMEVTDKNLINDIDKVTLYYLTFEFEDGKRKEFKVKNKIYGILIEGDKGILKYQGSQFISFNKK